MASARDILMGSGLPSIKLNKTGDRFDGVVVEIGEPFQARDYDDSSKLKFWDSPKNEQPIMTVPIEMTPDAGGQAAGLYVTASSDLQKALAKAIRESGARELEPGGHLSVAVIGMEETIKNGKKLQDKKLHGAVYTPPPSRGQAVLSAPVPAAVSQPAQPTIPVDLTRPPASQPAVSTPVVQPAAPGLPAMADLPPEMQELMRQYMSNPQAGK